MELSVRVVCRPELAAGFELAGLRADTAVDAPRRAGDPAVGIVLVDERLHRALPADVVRRLERLERPLVTTFPGPRFAAAEAAEEVVVELLRRAIGYRVRLP
jgi:vacuolar-type H+-ATPase subunit F/Vma7